MTSSDGSVSRVRSDSGAAAILHGMSGEARGSGEGGTESAPPAYPRPEGAQAQAEGVGGMIDHEQINIGCGPDYKPGWFNIDPYRGGDVQPDYVGSIFRLPFRADRVARAYCGHVLEHLPLNRVVAALAEVRRVLQPGGVLMIVGPDCGRVNTEHGYEEAERTIFGTGHYEGDEHLWTPTPQVIQHLLRKARFLDGGTYDIPARRDLVRAWRITGPEITAQCLVMGIKPTR